MPLRPPLAERSLVALASEPPQADRINGPSLDLKRIFWFWLPLAAVWLMMGIEPPVVAAGVARLPDPKVNLAAFGVAFAVALLMESPVIQLLAAATALVDGSRSYRRLRLFTHLLSLGLVIIHLSLGLSPAFDLITRRVMGVNAEISAVSRSAFLVLAPWAPSIAYRRFWQGVLIRHDRTGAIPVTMAARLVAGFVVVVATVQNGGLPGALAGATALTAGVITSAVVAWIMARPVVRDLIPLSTGTTLAWSTLLRFYTPLALTTILLLAIRPVLTAGIARAPDPLDSLALFPVLTGFLFVFTSMSISYQEAVIALQRDRRDRTRLTVFALLVAVALTLLYLAGVLTPLRTLWFGRLSDLPVDLLPKVLLPALVTVPMPAALVVVSLYRGVLISVRKTRRITLAMGMNFAVVALGSLVLARALPLPGIVTGMAAMTVAVAVEVLYLTLATGRIRETTERTTPLSAGNR
jgi:hypothetical protein